MLLTIITYKRLNDSRIQEGIYLYTETRRQKKKYQNFSVVINKDGLKIDVMEYAIREERVAPDVETLLVWRDFYEEQGSTAFATEIDRRIFCLKNYPLIGKTCYQIRTDMVICPPHPVRGTRKSVRKVLVDSIRERGMVNPIHVTPILLLASGFRRYEAAKEIGMETIPAIIVGLEADLVEYMMEQNYLK